MIPKARSDRLLVEQLPDEVLVYDLESHRVHCLNRTAAFVRDHCDGKTTVNALAEMLEAELETPEAARVVWLALKQLDKAHLLEERVEPPPELGRVSRRELAGILRNVAKATLVLPVVSSILAPTPAAAQSAVCVSDCTGQPAGTPCLVPFCLSVCDGVGSCL